MLISELIFAGATYFTLWLYRRLFEAKKYGVYFLAGTVTWILYLYGRTEFQIYYLRSEPGFKAAPLINVFLSNITFVIVCFLFITSCKFFKDGYIRQQFDAERQRQQLMAEINNLKSQIAPHFLFNTLNNLYGLAVEKSDKLPDLMLRLSDLLRHSLYETQKAWVPLKEELSVLKSYIELERVRLEHDLELEYDNPVPEDSGYQIAPLILIVFMENSFKHAKHVKNAPVRIYIKVSLEKGWFGLTIKNNYNPEIKGSENGIGLINVQRRLEILYPEGKHQLMIYKDEQFFTIALRLQLEKAI